jgi:two-component system, OmpR family, phosphate regulon sensor histidine kinase PhoR
MALKGDGMALAHSDILEHIDSPALLVFGGRVNYANPAAQSLLGGHVLGQDVRLAIRIPEALALVMGPGDGRVRVSGLSHRASIWEVATFTLGDGTQLITLHDLSIQSGVAKAHADFVANASHELRTPLAAILGYVETLADPKAGEDEDTRARFLGIIAREASRMQALIEDLMSLSRIEAIKSDRPTDPVDLVAIAGQVRGEASDPASVVIQSNVASALVPGDASQLSQVVRNLIDNAAKYGKPNGKIDVVIEATETGWVSLTVADEGDGVAPEHLPRLTERFYRADAARSRQAGGTGLGLSIVKHIVERHRGRLDISSRIGEGTRASIMLPLSAS